jgi:hypothetical protein
MTIKYSCAQINEAYKKVQDLIKQEEPNTIKYMVLYPDDFIQEEEPNLTYKDLKLDEKPEYTCTSEFIVSDLKHSLTQEELDTFEFPKYREFEYEWNGSIHKGSYTYLVVAEKLFKLGSTETDKETVLILKFIIDCFVENIMIKSETT